MISTLKNNTGLVIGICFLLIFSGLILRSVAPFIYPLYFIYVFVALLMFVVFSQIGFDILSIFSPHFYVGSLIFLALPLLIGQVTRGAIRWIPIGALTIQPAEIVRPFLLIFFANFLLSQRLTYKRIFKAFVLLILPLGLILLQRSLGVTILTFAGFIGVLIAAGVDRKLMLTASLAVLFAIPLSFFLLAPYQKERVYGFIEPYKDPSGTGYNSIQSMIAVGSGKFAGRGLGEGIQTQLSFLPERHTDFIFASTAEEMGFLGAGLLLLGSFFVLYKISGIVTSARNPEARAFASGIFLTLFVQTVIHIGMNMGLFPITGVPLPLVSAGGSSLIATMMALGMVVSARA